MNKLFKFKFKTKLATLFLSISLLFSCGDPVTTLIIAGVGGTGIFQGPITGFGSVFVNGVEFETGTSSFDVNGDNSLTQSDLSIGMIVTIKGSVNNDGLTGTATSLVYDKEIDGPISNVPSFVTGSNNSQKTFSILGYTVIADNLSTHYKNTSFDTLTQNDLIEISGYVTGNNQLFATLVKKSSDTFVPGSSEVEMKGNISALTSTSFNLSGITINYSIATNINIDASQLSEGIYVEVTGTLGADNSISADKIEQKSVGFENSDNEISLSGVISNYGSNSNFTINGQVIDASNATQLEPLDALSLLKDGLSIEISGTVTNSIFIAKSLELDLNNIKLSATIISTDPITNTIQLGFTNITGSIEVKTDNSTQFDDDSSANIDNLSFAGLSDGNFIEIEATKKTNGIFISKLKRVDSGDALLQGTVDSSVSNTSITILGITYLVDSNTDYDGMTPANFFSQLSTGPVVRIKDNEPADGVADKVDIED